MRTLMMLLPFLLSACTDDATPNLLGPDAGDAPGDPVAQHDAPAPIVPGWTAIPVNCEPYTRTVEHTATDGSREITTNTIAMFPTINAGDQFLVRSCRLIAPPPACNSGDTCTGSTQPGGTALCSVTSSGEFIDNQLSVYCGTQYTRVAANGTVLSSSTTSYSVTVEVMQ